MTKKSIWKFVFVTIFFGLVNAWAWISTSTARSTKLMTIRATACAPLRPACVRCAAPFTVNCSIAQISGSTGLLNSNALLGPLSDNGGSTHTIALLAGSNAIDAGPPVTGCLDGNSQLIFDDQRGFFRNVGGCDVGAFEYGAIDPNEEIFRNGFEGP